ETINKFFNDIPKILLDELRKNSLILNKLEYNHIIASISYLSSIICNKQITKKNNLNIPHIPKSDARALIKNFLEYIDNDIIKFLLEKNILLSETKYDPINTIAFYDEDQTIRAVRLQDDLLQKIWNGLPPIAQKNQKMKRYFKYKIDNPPLTLLIPFISEHSYLIDYVKGHGVSPVVKIPKVIDKDLAYLLGAIRDGGIHYDFKNNAYKIHFEQKSFAYLEEEIQPRLERVFDLETYITSRPDNVYQVQFASKPLYLLLSKCFGMREIHQFWRTPILIENADLYIQKEYIKGFFDAEGTYEHLYHSWFKYDECEPLEFISKALNDKFCIRCTEPRIIKTNDEFNRFTAYQIYINDFHKFQRLIMAS
ncbi:MAG: hypothetical protein ACFFAO_20175, partial [Candidatus Hermodarchaeota archaeon]